jgi:general secretion pathway protein E
VNIKADVEIGSLEEAGLAPKDHAVHVDARVHALFGEADLAQFLVLRHQDGHLVVLASRAFTEKSRSAYSTLMRTLERQSGRPVPTHLATLSLMRSLKSSVLRKPGARQSASGEPEFDAASVSSEVLSEFQDIVRMAAVRGASDIHICGRRSTATRVLFRLQGAMVDSGLPLSFARATEMIRAAYNNTADKGSNTGSLVTFERAQRAAMPATVQVNGATIKLKLRFEVTPVLDGFDAVMRLLWQSGGLLKAGESIEADLLGLGYLPDQVTMISRASRRTIGGLIFAGQTGSGKTTTLYKILGHIAVPGKKTYSVEDPIEGKLGNASQIQVNIAEDTNMDKAISDIVKSILRLDPDIVMVSEIRGSETGSAFKQLIQTGHQVLSTVHCSSALGIYERLASSEINVPRDVLAGPEFLSLLVYQKLVRRLCDHCKVPLLSLPSSESAAMRSALGQLMPLEQVCTTNADGCEHCRGTGAVPGVAGRTVCAEVVFPTPALLKHLVEGRPDRAHDALRRKRTRLDHPSSIGKSAMEVALHKVSQGLVDPLEVEGEFMPLELYIEMQDAEQEEQESAAARELRRVSEGAKRDAVH